MGVIEAVLNRRVARFYLRLSAQIRVHLRSSDFFSWLGQIPVGETYKRRSTIVIGAEIPVVKLRTVRHVPNTGQGCVQSEHQAGPRRLGRGHEIKHSFLGVALANTSVRGAGAFTAAVLAAVSIGFALAAADRAEAHLIR
jgi:hypothetical protein